MPEPYLDLLNSFLVAVGAYDQATASLVRAAIAQSLVLRASAGWRPFEHEGFEVLAGYTAFTVGGGLGGADAIEATTGHRVERSSGREIPMRATMHALHLWLGWALEPVRHWVVRVAIGWCHTVAAEADVGTSSARGQVWQRAAEQYLADTLRTWGFSPEVHLMTGARS